MRQKFCCYNTSFVVTKVCLLWQKIFFRNNSFFATNICHDKHNFVELTFVMKIRVCHDKTRLFIKSNFVVTKVLSQQAYFCHDKRRVVLTKLLLQQKWYLWQLTPMIEYLVKRLLCCVQGQGHSKHSKFQCLSRWYILWTSKPFVWYVIAGISCENSSVAIFKVNLTVRVIKSLYDCFCYIFWNSDLFAMAAKLLGCINHHEPEY